MEPEFYWRETDTGKRSAIHPDRFIDFLWEISCGYVTPWEWLKESGWDSLFPPLNPLEWLEQNRREVQKTAFKYADWIYDQLLEGDLVTQADLDKLDAGEPLALADQLVEYIDWYVQIPNAFWEAT